MTNFLRYTGSVCLPREIEILGIFFINRWRGGRTGQSRTTLYRKRKREIERQLNIIMEDNGEECIENVNSVNMTNNLANERVIESTKEVVDRGNEFTVTIRSDDDENVKDNDFPMIENSETKIEVLDSKHMERNLSNIFIANNVTRTVANSLLKLLKKHLPHYNLPGDARALLKTPRCVRDRAIGGGRYHHFGLERSLRHACQGKEFLEDVNVNELSLQVNIDGLPIFKSSSNTFWPILVRVYSSEEVSTDPFAVGIFFGESKPTDVNEFLEDFCDDYLKLKETGIEIQNRHFAVSISCFICDAPARAYVKRVKSHSGYHGCDRCTVKGVYAGAAVRFLDTTASLRTDEDFIRQKDAGHHLGTTCLSDINLGLVTGFPSDYMHLVTLGVMRRLLMAWTRGKQYKCRLSLREREKMGCDLVSLAPLCPTEFRRKPRSVKEQDRWKATEFRTFLLYTGVVVMKIAFKEDKLKPFYEHFLLLSCGMRLLLNDDTCVANNSLAEALLKKFVKGCHKLYGDEFVTYNVHCLIHLASDALRFGNLETVSAFPFENYLQKVKRLLRGYNGALSQVVKRIEEERSQESRYVEREEETVFLGRTTGKPCPDGLTHADQFVGVVHKGVRYTTLKRDNCIITENAIALIVNVIKMDGGALQFVIRKYSSVEPLFMKPLDSRVMSIAQVDVLSKKLECITIDDIKNKCFRMAIGKTTVAVGYTSHRKV